MIYTRMIVDRGSGVVFRVLVVRQVAGRRTVLRHAHALSSVSSRFHLLERLAE